MARLAARTPDGVIRLILLGVGDGSPAELRRAGAALARQVQRGQQAVAALPSAATREDADAFTEGLLLGGYTFSMRDGASDADPVRPRTVQLLVPDQGGPGPAGVIAYATTLEPGVTVDLATLTGAARIALGASIGALYTSDDELARALTAAGSAAGEPRWRMPMPADYRDAITSATADLAHVPSAMNGAKNGQAGSIVAAMFLREFTGGRRWAHLDIAGSARAGSDDGEITNGGTGFGTRLLLRWLTTADL